MRREFWQGRRVLVTGHTGFKGSWLSFWLREMEADLSGYALPPDTAPSLFDLVGLADSMCSQFADIRDQAALESHLRERSPEVIFHLAAQPLVRHSYETPVETFATNVMGTVHLLDAVRRTPSVRAVVVVTSDKCYENREWAWGYRENEPMGGHDPYSASKGCAELVTAAMRQSYFTAGVAHAHPARVASARAGNVIGGGDWCADRLVPDIVRECLGASGTVHLRNPGAVRPWQHVLEALRGYLVLAEHLVEGAADADAAWNFGPTPCDEASVAEVADAMIAAFGMGQTRTENNAKAPHEANLLRLDIAKAQQKLGWTPLLDFERTVATTAAWYVAWNKGLDMAAFTLRQIEEYESIAI